MSKTKAAFSKKSNDTRKPIRRRETAKAGRKPCTMMIQAGESDEVAIREFINECIVPILAERFMGRREI